MNKIKQVMELVCAPKYLQEGETFKEGMYRIADTLKDDEVHREVCMNILMDRRFLPGGRIQASIGSARLTTAFNCYVSDTIQDSMEGIMLRLKDAAQTMRLGGGDGFDFSTLRPKNATIKSLDSFSSGPISFMRMWDTMCATIKSAGHRRGAMMAVMRVDHPDIEEFITCKQKAGELTNFNISVAVTEKFMEAVKNDEMFDLTFPCGSDNVYRTVSARMLWNKIMRSTWDHAEPGVLYIDKINRKNNLYYCEKIAATNPCGEQPLPPNGACLLGSLNLTRYCHFVDGLPEFNFLQFIMDIKPIVRMMDNVIDNTIYPLIEQEMEAKDKRRMGLGITGFANACSFLGMRYGGKDSLAFLEEVLSLLRDQAYLASSQIAKEKGSFPAFDKEKYCAGEFFKTLPEEVQQAVKRDGIRNSHLLSIAPTGTISLWAGNISSGIEPVFMHSYNRNVYMPNGEIRKFYLEDYAYSEWGVKGETSDEVTVDEHINVLNVASRLVDSACSKTCNVGDNVTFEEFKELYMMAYEGGASGCTTYRPAIFETSSDTRGAVLERIRPEQEDTGDEITEGAACFINEYGERECAD